MDEYTIGTAALPIVLVADGQQPPGIVTRLCVQASRADNMGDGVLQVVGPAWLDDATETRWRNELIPHVRAGLDLLDFEHPDAIRWRVGLRLPDAAALSGKPCLLEGASADACFLALLIGSVFGIRTRESTLLTGTARIDDGRLGLVGHLPEKLLAAAHDPAIRRFIHPPVNRDGSGAWTPQALSSWEGACQTCDQLIQHRSCNTLAAAVRSVLFADSRIAAVTCCGLLDTSPIEGAPGWVNDLLRLGEPDWTRMLDRRVHAGRQRAVQQLLAARLEHAVRSRNYPVGIGQLLSMSLQTVPIGRRRDRLGGLLISTAMLTAVTELAGEQDQEDLSMLISATGHRTPGDAVSVWRSAPDMIKDRSTPEEKLRWLIEHRSELEASQRIDRALDEARMSFQVELPVSLDNAAFDDLITSFYAHLCRCTGWPLPPCRDLIAVKAMQLVDQAFARDGGYKTALANARDHTQGGTRRVLDLMTDVHKSELRHADAQRDHLLAISGHDLESTVAQAADMVERFGPLLPKRFREIPPEFLAGSLHRLVDEAVQSTDRLNQHLRNL